MNLPEVEGSMMLCSIAEFEHRCRVFISEEQRKLSPDNFLISLLCDALRLSREYISAVKLSVEIQAKALEDAATEWDLWTANTLRERAKLIRGTAIAEPGEKVSQ